MPRAGNIQKLSLLIRRNFRLLWRDKTMFLMLAIPPLIALVDFVLSSPTTLNPDRAPIIFGLLVFLVLLTSAVLVQNEIFKEKSPYQRESRTSSLAFPYILSKVWLVGILAIYQGLIWSIIHLLATGLTGGLQVLPAYAITFFLVAFIGGILGLLASTMSRSAMTTTNWVLLFTIPQLVLSGSVIPLQDLIFPFRFLSQVNPSRYALETLLAISGYGQEFMNVDRSIHWFTLAALSLCLIILLVAIQQGTESVRT